VGSFYENSVKSAIHHGHNCIKYLSVMYLMHGKEAKSNDHPFAGSGVKQERRNK
jgi:hypothetical protein